MTHDTNITVIDSIMGSGKTTWMMKKINSHHLRCIEAGLNGLPLETQRYIYITPTLSEVDRVTSECASLDFRSPEPIEGRKLHHLDTLINEGHNICTTHSLFSMLTREIYAKLRGAGYTLVIDEVLECVDLFLGLSAKDRELLFTNEMVKVDPATNRLLWNEDKFGDYAGRFDNIRDLCRNGNLVLFRGSLLIWEFPIDFFKCFDQVYILTYLFHGSAMVSYLATGNLTFNMKAIRDGELVNWHSIDEGPIKESLRSLITIYEGPMNKVGDRTDKGHPFSSSWFDKATDKQLSGIKASCENFFKRYAKTPFRDNAFTTFKKVKAPLSGKGYGKGFLPNNLRSTNEYIEKKSMAYMCNIFYHPHIRGYFTDRGIPVYEELHSLSEMIQWIWRSQIRRGDPITLFIPSQRMRNLLKIWLHSTSIRDLFRRAGYGEPPVVNI